MDDHTFGIGLEARAWAPVTNRASINAGTARNMTALQRLQDFELLSLAIIGFCVSIATLNASLSPILGLIACSFIKTLKLAEER
jgi:hypothetical protein